MIFFVVEELDSSDLDPADVQPIKPQRLHIVLIVLILISIRLFVFLILRHVVLELYLKVVDHDPSEGTDVYAELGHYFFYLG